MNDYLVVPAAVATDAARVWVGNLLDGPHDAAEVAIEHPPSGRRWPVSGWEQWQGPGGVPSVRYQRVPVTGLAPGTRHLLQLRVGAQVRAHADLTTLPEALPLADQPPFVVLLGSCFCRLQDASGRVGRTFAQLPDAARPSVKFLVGDQVYLDSPWYRFPIPHSNAALARGFFEHYRATWTQGGDVQGFNQLLRSGATYFCADDHEFWNNAPFPSSFAVNTWTDGGRRAWWDTAEALYRAFQTTASRAAFRVGHLEFLVLDTRRNRARDRGGFLSHDDMSAFEAWVAGLTAPGVLVLGQPIFAGPAGVAGHISDWNLPDFEQYRSFCRVLLDSRQSVVVLTGDVHYGRIATAPLRSGAELVEIIASPMALVDRSAGGSWHKAPDRFPAVALEGLAGVPVHTRQTWNRFANHFVTLEFTGKGGGVQLVVRAWETEPAGTAGGSEVVAQLELERNV